MHAPMGAITREMGGAAATVANALVWGQAAGAARRAEREVVRARGVDAVSDLAGRLRSARAGEAAAQADAAEMRQAFEGAAVEARLLEDALRAERARTAALVAALLAEREAHASLKAAFAEVVAYGR